jgi:flagellar hook-associated protein 1 FlgK
MGGLLASLISTTGALRAYERSIYVIQNNVSNADTAGFASQRLTFLAKPFDIYRGLVGGTETGSLVSSRDAFAERNVWRQNHLLGRWSQQTRDLESVEPVFAVAPDAGIPGALNRFFNSVSSWSVNPNDSVARQLVLERAGQVSRTFQEGANALAEASSRSDQQIRATIGRINTLTSKLRDLNIERRSDRRKLEDPALDAQIHQSLEELSQLADFNVVEQADGSLTLLLGGQIPLVIGSSQVSLRADFSAVEARILDKDGNDVSPLLGQGSLKALLDTRNVLLPSYRADLDRLAATFADRVNQVLASGIDAGGSSPTVDLFTYDPVLGAAATLAVNPLSSSQLAGAEPGAPGGNGNALRLAALATSAEIDGYSFAEFYGNVGARVGHDLEQARSGRELQQELVLQAKMLREAQSGVSLDEEAARLVEAQRAYQANAQLFTVLNSLTETVLGLLR